MTLSSEGTTGKPKGVEVTSPNVLPYSHRPCTCFSRRHTRTLLRLWKWSRPLSQNKQPASIVSWEFSHSIISTVCTQNSLSRVSSSPCSYYVGAVKLLHFPSICGIPVVIQARFDPVQFCANIERYRITSSLIVPPVLVALARHPGTRSSLCSQSMPSDGNRQLWISMTYHL
jgi:acyl-CoA synthetase (AMP-forming)/AMP-acid ligase II